MILKVARLGHPVLRQVARDLTPEEIHSPEIQRLVEDMYETMREYSGVGLAAPQVHQSVRILVMGVQANPRYPEAPHIPATVLFNLHLEPLGEAMEEDWEGCLSVPGLRGRVPRHLRVRARALDLQGNPLDFVAEGFHARVLQHEGDHLDGKVYIDRMRDTTSLSFLDEWQRYQGRPQQGSTAPSEE
jgi:peptide deformylase